MRKMFLFMMVSLDGYMEGEGHDLSWHHVDKEFNEFATEQMQKAETIVFGRRTYQLMESFWPSAQGLEDDPVIANLMNNMQKLVFSKSLASVQETDIWKNVRLEKGNVTDEIKSLKQKEGKPIVVLGSNNLCVTLLQEGLLDELRIMINPVVIGKGTPLFAGIKKCFEFTLTNTRTFANGNILLTYTVLYKK